MRRGPKIKWRNTRGSMRMESATVREALLMLMEITTPVSGKVINAMAMVSINTTPTVQNTKGDGVTTLKTVTAH